ncbi:amidohydrolase family protein [Neolewinella aurantiaca]|uniref:Amidohydrolase family protein n=1 Tax=Neolewinella aurantiaca TaxID=2602767 RepID=A0A5C7FSP5_9BACT|nr:amidohydrolase family protein [Neolewinella aurantiaca]TXF91097.1 amidohydrolase family protein [Neolewinella aurantiaca]
MRKQTVKWFLPFLLLLPVLSWAQDERPPVTRAFFIDNAFIMQEPGKVIDLGSVVIRNGLIEAVGKGLKAPLDAKTLEGDSLYVYAGFIEGLSHTGVPKPKQPERGSRPEVKDPGNPPNSVAGIQPERSVTDMMKADDKSVSDMRALGFTAAHVVPYGGMLPGQGAIVLLGGDDEREMVLRTNTSLYSAFEGGRRVYPSTTMAIMSKYRELYMQAEQVKGQSDKYATNARGMNRPEYDEVLEAFFPVIDKKMPVFFEVDDVKEVHRAIGLSKELGFDLVLAEMTRGQLVMDKLKATSTPVFLSLDLPKEKKEDKKKGGKGKGDKKDADEKKDKKKGDKEMSPEKKMILDQAEARRDASRKELEEQAAMLAKGGVDFGFSTLNVKAGEIRAHLGRMIKAGLTEDQALAALTTTPAKMLGIADVAGTVEKGKIANLVVTDKPYFAEGSNVRYVIVDGTPHEYEAKKKKKSGLSDPNATVKAAGEWTITIDVPGQSTESTLTITDDGGSLSGTMSAEGESRSLSDVTLDGSNLTFGSQFEAGGQRINLSFDLIIDGNNIEGSVKAGNFGSFDVEGSRTPE